MKRILVILFLIFTGLTIALLGTASLVFRSDSVHRYILSRINKLIPGTFSLGRMRISPFDLQLDLRDVTLTDSSGGKLVTFDRLYITIATSALLRKTIIVKKAVLERPQVFLAIDSSGTLSLLHAFPQGSKQSDSQEVKHSRPLPRLEVRDLSIIGGSTFFTKGRDSLQVRVYGLSLSAKGSTVPLNATVSLSLDSAVTNSNGAVLHLYDAALRARMNEYAIDSAHLTFKTDSSTFALDGQVSSLTDTPFVLQCSIAADVALSELRTILGIREALDGSSKLRLQLQGSVGNPDLAMTIAYGGGNVMGFPIDSLLCRLSLHDRIVQPISLRVITAERGLATLTGIVDLNAMFPYGFTAVPGSVDDLRYQLEVLGKKIPLAVITPTITGTGDATVSLSGSGIHPDSLAVEAKVNVHATSFSFENSSQPLGVTIACSTGIHGGSLQVHHLTAMADSTELVLDHATYQIPTGAMTGDLHLNVPSLATLLGVAGMNTIRGSAFVSSHIGGDIKHPEVKIALETDSGMINSLHIGSIQAQAQLHSTGSVSLNRLQIDNKDSRIVLSGMMKLLEDGKPLPLDRMAFECHLQGNDLHPGDFIDSTEGRIRVDVHAKGIIGTITETSNHPDRTMLDGSIEIQGEDLLMAGQRITSVDLAARLAGNRLHLHQLAATIAPGQQLTGTGWASINDSFSLTLKAPEVHLNTFNAIAAIDSLDGVLSVAIEGSGTYRNPSVNGKVSLTRFHKGVAQFDDIVLDVTLADSLVEAAGTAGGPLYVLYNIKNHSFSADLRCSNLSLTPYLALSGQRLSGLLTADLSILGSTDSLSAMSAYLNIATLSLDYDTIRVIETSAVHASFIGTRYTIPLFRLALATDGTLDCRAEGWFAGPHDVTVNGTIPLTVIRHITPDIPEIEGAINLDASLKGAADIASLQAELILDDVATEIPGLEQRLHGLTGRIHADQHTIRFESLKGSLDDGTLRMNGELKLEKLTPSTMRADLELKNLPVTVPDMLDLVLDGKLRMSGTPDTTLVAGDLVLIDGLYYQDLVLNPLGGSGGRKRKVVPQEDTTATPYLHNLRFDVGVQARRPLQAENNLFQLTVAPDLHLMGTLKQPTISGRADVQEGTITYLNKTFTVNRGVVDFVNPYAIEPTIDIEGTFQVRSRIITILLSGTPDNLSFTLSCNDPTLEDQDILSLLVLGKTTAELQSDFRSNETFQSSQQMIASLVASTLGDEIKKSTGLDVLDIETVKETGDTTSRFAVTVGKKLTKRLSTTYRVESINNEITQRAAVEYQLLQNLIVTGFQYLGGIYGGELKLTWEGR